MLFNSIEFLIFFPIVVILYFILPYKLRLIFLLIASYYFYINWKPEYVIIILVTTLLNFFIIKKIDQLHPQKEKNKYLYFGLIVNLGFLFVFKYLYFFSNILSDLLSLINIYIKPIQLDLLQPVGISFYTFLLIGYLFDVYRGRYHSESNPIKFALFVSFFPSLLAGPIERSNLLLPQFDKLQKVDYERITYGLKLMIWGFFKKIVIADRLALIVSNVYDDPTNYSGLPLIIATYFFAIQIYCDFSGYSDIAIGAAKILGIDLMDNFHQPYFAKSIGDFWRRWHISLTTWFRDYIYIPWVRWSSTQKKYQKRGPFFGDERVYTSLILLFLISGLWHGASWNFVIWGLLHGIFLAISTFLGKHFSSLTKLKFPDKYMFITNLLKIFATFHLVLVTWVFFRANSLSDAIYIFSHFFTGLELKTGYGLNMGGTYEILITVIAILLLILFDFFRERGMTIRNFQAKPIVLRWVFYFGLIFFILMFGQFNVTEFIYFQF